MPTMLFSTRHPFRVLGCALLWGLAEAYALARSRVRARTRGAS
jgi:hypothetical protein